MKKYCRHHNGVPAGHRVKMKEKRDKYLDFARAEKAMNMKVMVILIVTDTLETIPKGLEKKLKEQEVRGRIQTTAQLS